VCDELARWLGRDGCRVLVARALTMTRAQDYPALDGVHISVESGHWLDGFGDAAARYGGPAATEAAGAVLAALIELLGRLIGDDMARSLLDRSVEAGAPRESLDPDRVDQ
jgi:hypothetical protein